MGEMKKGTKKLIVRTIEDRIADYERSIESCRKSNNAMLDVHIEKLVGKVTKLNEAIKELESA
jgi:hypothetical protein